MERDTCTVWDLVEELVRELGLPNSSSPLSVSRSCPECRVVSEFVIPSVYWVEDQDEKNRLIEEFKSGVRSDQRPTLLSSVPARWLRAAEQLLSSDRCCRLVLI